MEKKKSKQYIFIIVLITLLLASILSLSFAWFTDRKDFSSTITFGNILLDVTGDSAGENGELKFNITRDEVTTTTNSKVMPGDVVNIDLTIGLKSNSQPAYYLLKLTDKTNKVFASTYYFGDGTLENGKLVVYETDGTTSWVQGDKTKTVDKKLGLVSNSATPNKHTIKIQAKIQESFEAEDTSTEIKCDIFAIQQANLTPEQALQYILAGFDSL